MMYVAFINIVFMLNLLKQKFFPQLDLSRLCFEEYRRMMAHVSTTVNEDNPSQTCDNCGNPYRDCQLIECLVEMVLNELPSYVKKDCYGCQQEAEGQFINSQLNHDMCMMTEFEDKAQRYTMIILHDIINSQDHLDELWKSRMPILLNDIFSGLSLDTCIERMDTVRNNYALDQDWLEKCDRTILENVINRGIYYEM